MIPIGLRKPLRGDGYNDYQQWQQRKPTSMDDVAGFWMWVLVGVALTVILTVAGAVAWSS